MAELKFGNTKRIALLFVEAYNKENNTTFTWDDDRSYQPGEPYDFKLFEGKKELGIQVIRAVADPDREFVRPNRSSVVIDLLKPRLERMNLPPLLIHLNFETPPATKEEIGEAVFWLEHYIPARVSHSVGSAYFDYDTSFDEHYLPHIKKYISDIRIAPLKGERKSKVVFSFGWSKNYPEPWLDDEQRVSAAARKKASKYPEVIVLIDSGSFPVHEFYIPLIKETLSQVNLKEVWLVDDFLSQSRAIKVK